MDMKAMFKIQCGLYVAAVGTPEKINGCVTNTLMQQSHAPVKLSLTIQKANFTHDMILAKRSVGVSALSSQATTELIKRFGFQSGRDVDKFDGFSDYLMDDNGNPILTGDQIAATYSLTVYETIDMGSHTMFLCTADDAKNFEQNPITYWDYRESKK